MRVREEEGEADRSARLHSEHGDERRPESPDPRCPPSRDLAGQTERNPDVSPTKPKLWSGPEKKKPGKKVAKSLAQPAEKIPDEVEVLDEQAQLGYTQ